MGRSPGTGRIDQHALVKYFKGLQCLKQAVNYFKAPAVLLAPKKPFYL